MTNGGEESMRITGPGIELEIRRGRKDDPRGEYLILALAGAPDLPQALQRMLHQALARPWMTGLPLGTAAPWPWMPAPTDPLGLQAWPLRAWLDLWRTWSSVWLCGPTLPRQE